MGAVLWKSSQCSQPLSHLSSPPKNFSLYFYFMCMCVLPLCMPVQPLHIVASENKRCQIWWESNLGPLQEKSVLLTAELFLQPQIWSFSIYVSLIVCSKMTGPMGSTVTFLWFRCFEEKNSL